MLITWRQVLQNRKGILNWVSVQVAQRVSTGNAQELPVASNPSSRTQSAAPQRPGFALSEVMHTDATKSMLACKVHCTDPFRAPFGLYAETASNLVM